jgi:hypothetical protein
VSLRLKLANSPVLVLIGAALLLRALIPTGWMPTPTLGGFAIQLCSSGIGEKKAEHVRRAQEVFHAALTGSETDRGNKGQASDQPCSFAALPLLATPPATPEPPLNALALAQFRPLPMVATVGRGLPAPPPPSTGPPHLA